MALKISVLYGSVRQNRQGIKAAKFIESELKKRGHEVFFVDALKQNFPMLDKKYKEFEEGKSPQNLEDVHKMLNESDGFVLVTAEYNHSPPPGLLNIIDHYDKEFFFKPAGVIGYSSGPFGGVRAITSIIPVLTELGMSVVPTSMPVSKVQNFKDDGTPDDEAYYRRAEKFLADFEWHTTALKEARKNGTPY